MNLLTAYLFHRYRTAGNMYPRRGPNPAGEAIKRARADMLAYRNAKAHLETVAKIRDDAAPGPDKTAAQSSYDAALRAVANLRRYAPDKRPDGRPWAAVTWQPGKPGLAHVAEPARAGLRYVGRVMPGGNGRQGYWDKRGDCGWHTDPYGDVFKDGTGLCYGVVYQLPARDGRARFVAGYEFGGTGAGPTIDFRTIYESESAENTANPMDHEDAQDAARAADKLAEDAAEHERDYQTAWAAGQQWADKGEEIATLRKAIIGDVAARRKVRADMARVGVGADSREWSRLCAMIAERVQEALSDIAELRAARTLLAQGDNPRLTFYPSQTLKDAFCEGAGLDTFPNV